ncbi:MAG: hypothetical protein M5U34_05010 [Chloroflexi bacterium]|nr:hypothetical protein [Chloroflexota bacterium]
MAVLLLTLSTLYFDVYETGEDLTQITNKLWQLMSPTDAEDPTSAPPEVKFKWASFQFTAVISELSVKYTLFDKDGEPLRSEVSVTFIQSDNPNIPKKPTKIPHRAAVLSRKYGASSAATGSI